MSGKITRQQFKSGHPSLASRFDSMMETMDMFGTSSVLCVVEEFGYTLDCGTPVNVKITIGNDEEGDGNE